jgi:8-oxo-dGTP pyrophosphatase MutT (NUDIX family)
MTRQLFPGCWDLIGGHVEDDKDVLSALTREIREETGWVLKTVVQELVAKHWNDGATEYEERQFIVRVEGELRNPVLEKNKVSEFMWVDRANLDRLKENRKPGDQLIYDSVLEALEAQQTPR